MHLHGRHRRRQRDCRVSGVAVCLRAPSANMHAFAFYDKVSQLHRALHVAH